MTFARTTSKFVFQTITECTVIFTNKHILAALVGVTPRMFKAECTVFVCG